jgi:hypothetical protein
MGGGNFEIRLDFVLFFFGPFMPHKKNGDEVLLEGNILAM